MKDLVVVDIVKDVGTRLSADRTAELCGWSSAALTIARMTFAKASYLRGALSKKQHAPRILLPARYARARGGLFGYKEIDGSHKSAEVRRGMDHGSSGVFYLGVWRV